VGALRRGLDGLYLLGGVLGALSLVAIALLILAGVVARQIGRVVPSVDDLTAFTVAGSAMLPLAYTFRHAAHIRVDLVIGRLRGPARAAMESLVLAVSFAMVGFFAYAALDTVIDSLELEEVSQGMLKIPIWLPQLALPVGAGLFALALLDDLVVVLAGGVPSYRRGEAASALDRAAGEV
jgi:TRAP-type C4-dicarboxylate transport system permease small subunit